jgi:hypothetical protein
VNSVIAVDLCPILEGILVVLGILKQYPYSLVSVLLHQSFRDFQLALVEVVNGEQTFLVEQLDAASSVVFVFSLSRACV